MGMTWTATCADRAHTQKPGQDRIFMDGNGQDKDRTGQGGRQGRANDKDRTDTMTVKTGDGQATARATCMEEARAGHSTGPLRKDRRMAGQYKRARKWT